MSMYNTDEVGVILIQCRLREDNDDCCGIVDYWIRSCLVQNGVGQEDASREWMSSYQLREHTLNAGIRHY
jgi:hypothetical protein